MHYPERIIYKTVGGYMSHLFVKSSFRYVFLFFFMITFVSIATYGQNPPARGFNAAASDARAIEIADKVMEAMGGRKNWDDTHYITWKFFGKRLHVWNKWSGDLRFKKDGLLVLMNLNTKNGKAWEDGNTVTDPDTLLKRLDYAYKVWINDSYWMFMPYKLTDSGVTLKYLGEGEMQSGRPAFILQLTFDNVGVTPQNKYKIWVDKEQMLVRQWAYFRNAGDSEPTMITPWDNWKKYGNILLSADRGKDRHHTDIAVFDELPEKVFNSPEPVDIMSFKSK